MAIIALLFVEFTNLYILVFRIPQFIQIRFSLSLLIEFNMFAVSKAYFPAESLPKLEW